MIDEQSLRDRARDAIRTGALPERGPERTYGGPGTGVTCAVCAVRISAADIEVEVELAAEDRRFFMHPRCFAAWDAECRVRAREA